MPLFHFCHRHTIQTEEDPEPRPHWQTSNIGAKATLANIKHRNHPGGRGNVGGAHHPGYFGKVGMKHYHLKRNQGFCPTVTLDKLWTLVSEQTQVNAAKNKTGVVPIIDFL
ncbi:hypothetical protein U0070_024478 [Myodes glareolus]|uniref:Large ribosomal subunit protein uL15 n=1 Tax=Myodes glareolus TaxID=447135 RepID=A0AAW0ISW7_MYOGA